MCQGFFPSLLSMSLVFSAWDISSAFAIILRCYASSWGLWCHKLWTSCFILISFWPSFVDMVSRIKDLFAIYCGLLPYHEDFCLTIYEVFFRGFNPQAAPSTWRRLSTMCQWPDVLHFHMMAYLHELRIHVYLLWACFKWTHTIL